MEAQEHDAWLRLNGVTSHVLRYGEGAGAGEQVLVVSGNPGIVDFYREFAHELHERLALPVYVLGHAGHLESSDSTSNVLKGQESKFNLQGQLDHKVAFINNSKDKNTKLHLIGHSIGAWMLVEILNNNADILARTASIQLLFPTLQYLGETRNGKVVNKLLRNIHWLVLLFVKLVFLLPIYIKLFFIDLYLKINSLPAHYCNRILKYINPYVIEKVLFLAYDEMDTVKALNLQALEKIKHCTNVIYSTRDGWAPVDKVEELSGHQPSIEMRKVKCSHAFVLKSSEYIGEMVSQFILKKKFN